MSDLDKTIVMDASGGHPDCEVCPVCNTPLETDAGQADMLRCPICRFVKKQKVVIAPGNTIGNKYRVLNHLNSGGCGDLFLCHPLDNAGIRYVLKVLRNADLTNRKRFRREATLLSSITGEERIAKVIDYWETGEDAFIIMEYINGKNLKQLKDEFVFEEQTTLQIAYETAIALSYIWNNFSVIHRDIKPENIMLDENYCVKLLDFGLSKQCSDDEDTNITMARSGLGTPGYMSPEQYSDGKNADFRSDIFSLGATMFFLLTGEKPFKGVTAMEVYNDTLANSPPMVSRFSDLCSADCVNVIRKMMQRYPEDRYYSYEELLDDLERLIQ
ncbi:MAG: serine/threonine protein kinase [Lentisphaerae bacterium]|nr:serine/threonine protein kinase [Lentisphaerota bacterium]